LFPVLLTLNAKLEFQSHGGQQVIPIEKFDRVPDSSILVKVRIPVEEWEISLFRRLGPARIYTQDSGAFAFLANTQKGFLSDLRIAFGKWAAYRSVALENELIGTRLPLSQKRRYAVLEYAAQGLKESAAQVVSPVDRQLFLTLLEYSLELLT
jgi:CO/xanthine dehydrogenase FAD-binding subunit